MTVHVFRRYFSLTAGIRTSQYQPSSLPRGENVPPEPIGKDRQWHP